MNKRAIQSVMQFFDSSNDGKNKTKNRRLKINSQLMWINQ